jgi:hypothetical protein
MSNMRRRMRSAWNKVGNTLFGSDGLKVAGEFRLIARDPRIAVSYPGLTVPKLLWDTEWFANQVMNAAINDMLSVTYDAGTQKPQWYIAPINNTPTPSIVRGLGGSDHVQRRDAAGVQPDCEQ